MPVTGIYEMRETLGEYVNRMMRLKGLSLVDVQNNSGGQVSASYIGKVQKGEVTNLTTEKMVALAQGLGVDPYAIFAASYGKPPASQDYATMLALLDIMQRLVMNLEVLEAVDELLRLPVKEREVILKPLRRINKSKAKDEKKEH
jgi:transcriptional regulator with XRE-family HTH domain